MSDLIVHSIQALPSIEILNFAYLCKGRLTVLDELKNKPDEYEVSYAVLQLPNTGSYFVFHLKKYCSQVKVEFV